ncbi:MAG: glycosyltransferase family 4 protein [Lachnospiraceae bacterium]|nr:glycosyltransferase family 4 protein [Lachnospiraceae bacterium]
MDKVLLVCNYFAPDNTIAAIRVTKFAKYLKQYGLKVDCITEMKRNLPEDELLKKDICGIETIYASNSAMFLRFEKIFKKCIAPFKEKRFSNLNNRKKINPRTGHVEFYPYETAYPVLGSIEYLVGQIRQIDLYRSIKKYLEELDNYEYLITSYGDSFSYFVGKYFHRHHKKTVWLFDVRDAVYRYKFTPSYVSLIPKCYEKFIWKNADGIIGVSKGICRRVPPRNRKKVSCITNGYDWEDRKGTNREKITCNKLTFAFTGSMYGGLMDLSVLFRAVADLMRKKVFTQGSIEFYFAGNLSAFEIFQSQAGKYGLSRYCEYRGKLSRQDAMTLQSGADILLCASYDYQENEGGVITGKIFEYMTSGCPVIAIITGDIEKSELADIVRKTNIGYAYEVSHHKKDYEGLKQYLERQYKEKVQNGRVSYQPNMEELGRYDYQVLTKQLIKLMTKLRK